MPSPRSLFLLPLPTRPPHCSQSRLSQVPTFRWLRLYQDQEQPLGVWRCQPCQPPPSLISPDLCLARSLQRALPLGSTGDICGGSLGSMTAGGHYFPWAGVRGAGHAARVSSSHNEQLFCMGSTCPKTARTELWEKSREPCSLFHWHWTGVSYHCSRTTYGPRVAPTGLCTAASPQQLRQVFRGGCAQAFLTLNYTTLFSSFVSMQW